MDSSVFFSFDRSGFERHEKRFGPSVFSGSNGKRVLITGGNSGIGYAAARAFAHQGLEVHLLCRSRRKGEEALERLKKESKSAPLFLHVLDLADCEKVCAACSSLPSFDLLVNNAGSMPLKKTVNKKGEEEIFASQVKGHFILTRRLIESGKIREGGRAVFVTSGGMYLQKLQLEDVNWRRRPYNRYRAYANAKRAQVILTRLFAEKYPDIWFGCMHPGWVETKGVREAMPRFFRWMRKRLRTPEQGADTIVWLALTPEKLPGGRLWFDREAAAAYWFSWTKESNADRKELWRLCGE